MTTKPYHPICSGCLKSGELYSAWAEVAKDYKKGTKEYETACLRYKWHLANCNCRKGLRDG